MIRLEKITVIFLLLVTFGKVFAQNKKIEFKINGRVGSQVNDQYAYLYLNNSKRLLRATISNRQFKFLGQDTSNKKGLSYGHLFLSNDSSDRYIPLNEILLKQINRTYRSVVLEDTLIKIVIEGDVKYAKIEGGTLNKENDEMNYAAAEGYYEEFIEKHVDSPFSLLLISALLPLTKSITYSVNVNCQELFNKLSDRLKQSEYGIEIQRRINEP